ncbi:hypothetical protein K8R66_01275 [bacterium]|nr:hypothetical protein [bacterium]
MSKVTFMQKKFILDLGLRTEKEVENMTKIEVMKLLNEEVPKFHVRKLLEWKVRPKKIIDSMLPDELRKLYNSYRQLRKLSFLKEGLDRLEVDEKVLCRQTIDGKKVKISCIIKAIRYPKLKGRYFEYLDQNVTVQFFDGKKKAVNLNKIEKIK